MRSVMIFSPSLAKTSTLERSTKMCSLMRLVLFSVVEKRPEKSLLNDTAPDFVRSTKSVFDDGITPTIVSTPSPLRRRKPTSLALPGSNSTSIS